MVPRRLQKPIHIRSDRAAALLAQHTRDGRSQAAIIEDALQRLPLKTAATLTAEQQQHLARLREIVSSIPPGTFLTMKEFDALEYDEFGDPR